MWFNLSSQLQGSPMSRELKNTFPRMQTTHPHTHFVGWVPGRRTRQYPKSNVDAAGTFSCMCKYATANRGPRKQLGHLCAPG